MSAVLRLGAIAALLSASVGAFAGDVRLVSSVGMRGVMEQLKPEFERATANKLVITFGTAVPLKRQIDEGAAFDVAVLTPALVADLARSGQVDAQSVANVGRTGMGLAGRKDAAPADIGSAESLKGTLLAAKSVAHSKEGQSGVAAVKVMERLGISQQMQPRLVIETRPGGSLSAIVEGKAEYGFALLSEIVPYTQVKLIGPMPGALQSFTEFGAGVSSHASDAAAAKSFIGFLRGEAGRKALAANGMEAM
jgi:molybdate transport system substrate-binding protein